MYKFSNSLNVDQKVSFAWRNVEVYNIVAKCTDVMFTVSLFGESGKNLDIEILNNQIGMSRYEILYRVCIFAALYYISVCPKHINMKKVKLILLIFDSTASKHIIN